MNEPFAGGQYRHSSSRGQLPMIAKGQEVAIYDPYTWPGPSNDEFDLRRIWHIVRRYRLLIVTVVAVCMVTTLIFTLMMRPVYRATALVELKPNPGGVSFGSAAPTRNDAREFRATQVNILRSEAVTKRVIKELNLAQDPELTGAMRQRGLTAAYQALQKFFSRLVTTVIDNLSSSQAARHAAFQALSMEDSSSAPSKIVDERQLLRTYMEKLDVKQVPESDLLRVSFDSFSPKKAAEIANAHTEAYIRFNDERRFNSTSSAKAYLQKQIQKAQHNLERSERALTDFARKNNVVDVEDRGNVMQTRFDDLSRAVTETRRQRIIAQVKYTQAKTGDLESLPAVLANPMIRTLQQEFADTRAEYRQMSQVFKDTYPRMQQLKSKMEDIRSSLREESQKVVAGLKKEYEQLRDEEQHLSSQLKEQRSQLLDLKERAVSYNILKREWEASRELFKGLLDKQKDFSVAAGMEVSNASVVDKAAVPTEKFKPNNTMNVAMAGGFGLIGGLGIAFLLAFLDNTFKTREELEHTLGMPFMGIVPTVDARDEAQLVPVALISAYQPSNAIAEAVRAIRTGVLFSRPEQVPKKILITSTTSGEGKSTIALNLALVLAQGGSQVLIIDADLRKPTICKWLNVQREPGLSEYLSGNDTDVVRYTTFDNLFTVPAGGTCSRPTDLLASTRMNDYLKQVANRFDFVILDGPPCLGLADSMLLSTKVDGTLLVVRAGSTEKGVVTETVNRLRMVNAPLIGSILNSVDVRQPEYGYYATYYGYGGKRNRKEMEHQEQVSI